MAAGLLAAIAAVAIAPGVASAEATLVDPHPVTLSSASPPATAPETPTQAARDDASPPPTSCTWSNGAKGCSTCRSGTGCRGAGSPRPTTVGIQPDGGVLQRGQSRIYPGWELIIPVTTEAQPASAPLTQTGAEPNRPRGIPP